MSVWVVIGEFQQSRSGDVAWVAGVGKTKTAALVIAREDADLYDDELVLIDGKRHGRLWKKGDDDSDWTISYSITSHEVRSA